MGYVCWCAKRPTGRSWRATCACPATAPRSATAPPRSGCTCSGACCVGRTRPLSGRRARMFVALDLPVRAWRSPRWRDALVAARDELAPVPAEQLHVTLVFLGWQDEAAAERIAAAASSGFGAARRRDCAPSRVHGVPPRRPRLFALDLDDEGGRAGELQAAVVARARGRGPLRAREAPLLAAPDARAREARARRAGRSEPRPPPGPSGDRADRSTARPCAPRARSTSRSTAERRDERA